MSKRADARGKPRKSAAAEYQRRPKSTRIQSPIGLNREKQTATIVEFRDELNDEN